MYEKTKNEKYAENWFKENGFDFKLLKQYISKTKYEITKAEITEIFELPNDVTNIKKYMDMFLKSFEMKIEILKMKEQL